MVTEASGVSSVRVVTCRGAVLAASMLLGFGSMASAGVLSITKAGPGGARPGDEIAYAITISNSGPGDLAAVVLDDPTPAGLSLVSVSGDCVAFPCNFVTLASGATKAVTVRFGVPLAYDGPSPIVNTAVTHAGAADGITATASTAVTRVAGLHTLPPCRILDTRAGSGAPLGGPALTSNATRTLDLRELCGLPGNAFAISYNATVTGPTAAGNLRFFPGGTGLPNASAINYLAGQTRANNGIVPLSADGKLSVYCGQATGATELILDVNGYFASTNAVNTPLGQNVHVRLAPEVALTFDNVTEAGLTSALVLDFADNRSGAVPQDLKLFFPAGSAERALVPSVIVPDFVEPLGKGGPGGTPTFVLAIIGTTAKFTRTAEFHGFEDFRLGWDPPCVVAADPTQEPRTFYAREAPKNEPAVAEEAAPFNGPVFVDISSGCGSNKGTGWNFSLYLTARDTRSPHDIAQYMLNGMQSALSQLAAFITNGTVASTLSNNVTAALSALDTNPGISLGKMTSSIAVVDANPGAFNNAARNVSGELVGRPVSASYMIRKLLPPTGTVAEFPLPGPDVTATSYAIVTGPDGNLWFTEQANPGKVGMITPAGVITEFLSPGAGVQPTGITVGPDGNLWVANQQNRIDRVTTAGVFTQFVLNPVVAVNPHGIAAGSDGNIWYTSYNTTYGTSIVGRLTIPGGVVTEFALANYSYPEGIVAGPDGNLWFAELSGRKIGRITTAGVVTEFPLPVLVSDNQPNQITVGPDGNLWFTTYGNTIGRITTAGVITLLPVPIDVTWGIVAGPDGNLWFTEVDRNKIARITTAGVVTEYPIPTASSSPHGITVGPDGNLWFTEIHPGNGKISRISP
jgi:uncharacterized repeat protein (TIGR01451 family)